MKKTKNKLPINEFLSDYSKKKVVRFHMPGHNGGNALKKDFLKNILSYDITEITGADNLQNPTGIIKKSQENIAKKLNCIQSRYLVNGSTSGIQSVMKYISMQKGELLVSRDCHKSVINSALLFDVDFSFVFNNYDNDRQMVKPITLENIKKEVEKNTKIKYVFITSPNYFGFVAEVEKIAIYLHKKEMMLIVDQAHGGHFHHSDLLPVSALLQQADVVIESVHKTLAAINQSAMIHLNNEKIDYILMGEIINALLSTSPSYMMMAMMEKAMLSDFRNGYQELYENITHLKSKLNFEVIENDDFTRVVIDVAHSKMTGYKVLNYLSKQGIEIEMADFNKLVLIMTLSHTKADFKKLYTVLNKLTFDKEISKVYPRFPIAVKCIGISQAYRKTKKTVDLDRAEGLVCGTIVIPYPPGIPLLYFGETIDKKSISYIKLIIKNKGEVIGIKDNKIKVIEE